jgi:hypothetical protein
MNIRRTFLSSLIAFSLSGMLLACAPEVLSAGTVGYWDFNECGGDQAQDGSGYGHHAMLEACEFVSGPEIVGCALRFDGDSGIAWIQDSDALALTGPLTIEAWVRVPSSSPDAYQTIMMRGTPERDIVIVNYHLSIGEGRTLGFGYEYSLAEGERIWSDAGAVPVDEWTHLAVTLDSQLVARLYVNCELVKTEQFNYPPLHRPNATTLFGARWTVNSSRALESYFCGDLDGFRISDTAVDCSMVPIRPITWGNVKALYR